MKFDFCITLAALKMECQTAYNHLALYEGQRPSKSPSFLSMSVFGWLNIPSCLIFPGSRNTVPVKLEVAEFLTLCQEGK